MAIGTHDHQVDVVVPDALAITASGCPFTISVSTDIACLVAQFCCRFVKLLSDSGCVGSDAQDTAGQPFECGACGDMFDGLHGAGAAVIGDQEALDRLEGACGNQHRLVRGAYHPLQVRTQMH